MYAAHLSIAERKAYVLAIARAVSKRVVAAHGDTSRLVDAAGRAAGERRVLVCSADPAIESRLEQTALSGAIPKTSRPLVGLSVINDASNKLPYYLDRSLTWTRTGYGSTREVTVTIKLTNSAPATGLSRYVTNRGDRHTGAGPAGPTTGSCSTTSPPRAPG